MTKDQSPQAKTPKDLDQEALTLGIGGHLAPEKDDSGYKERMKRRKDIQNKRIEERNKRKGLLIVFTGTGKGKTTAALGMALRTIGHGERVSIIQFIKGGWEPGEARALKVFGDSISWNALGEGFTWETQDRKRDKELVMKAWEKSTKDLKSKEYKLVILDEIIIAIKLGYLSTNEVLKVLTNRPPFTHVVLTGRWAPKELINQADLVTEMSLIHHPFKEQGIKAQPGIEF